VRDAAATGSTRLLAEAEQDQGIVFDAESIAFDEDICKQANLPDSIYFDTMHNVCASGGFAQYEVNHFCRRVKGHGIPFGNVGLVVFVHAFASTGVCEAEQALVFDTHQ